MFVVPYPVGKAASQRFRVEQLLPLLQEQSIKYKVAPFWSEEAWGILYEQGHWAQKLNRLLIGCFKRLLLLLQLPRYSYIFIHREATPVGPPWFEWMAAKVFRKKIIFDFDDAIWLPSTTTNNNKAAKYKWHSKTESICRWSYKVSCGNKFLQSFANRHNKATVFLPTVIDTQHQHNQLKQQYTEEVNIGWTGSHSTLPYLKLIEPVLQRLEQRYDFNFIVIADKAPDLQLKSLRYVPWQQKTEINDLLQFNIGIMPLPDTTWAKGKCAFKALQYMALGIPAVVSAVGANLQAVPDGVAGYVCHTEQEWYNRLEQLLLDAGLRAEIGKAGRQHVQQCYSLQVYRQIFTELFSY
nr:glycosyltransferase family 4 protein [Pontibacter silvestris]